MSMRKIFPISLLFFVFLASLSSEIYAKKLLPRAKPAGGSGGTAPSATRGVTTSVKFRGDRLAIVPTFSNLGIASSVSYVLSYNSRGTTQGASGTLNPGTTTDPTVRELLFGTCSHGVCRYDYGITNARFVVTTVLKNGKRVVKSYKLKV